MMVLPPMHPVQSSNLEAVGHDGHHLYVRFHPSKKTGVQVVGRYLNVPAGHFDHIRDGRSPGQYLDSAIKKGGFTWEKLQ